jgi:hypothetical protein
MRLSRPVYRLAGPSYHRVLVKHGLIEKTLSIPEAYEVFLKVGADPEVQKLRGKVERSDKMKHVSGLYLATAMALRGMTKQELDALKLRIEKKALFLSDSPHVKRGLFVCKRRFQFVAFHFSLRSRCEEPRKKINFPLRRSYTTQRPFTR